MRVPNHRIHLQLFNCACTTITEQLKLLNAVFTLTTHYILLLNNEVSWQTGYNNYLYGFIFVTYMSLWIHGSNMMGEFTYQISSATYSYIELAGYIYYSY